MSNLKYILELCQFSANGKLQDSQTLWWSHSHNQLDNYGFLQLS